MRARPAIFAFAGDVYDGDWKDNKIGLFFNREIARLERADIPVFLLKGNHDAESVITNQRYAYISRVVSTSVVKKRKAKYSTSDKIDRIVTNRVLALPIFAAVMFIVYYLSITTIGDIVTGFTNDTLFGSWIMGPLTAWFAQIGVAAWLANLIVDIAYTVLDPRIKYS